MYATFAFTGLKLAGLASVDGKPACVVMNAGFGCPLASSGVWLMVPITTCGPLIPSSSALPSRFRKT